ncbi:MULTISPECIES: YgdI/YgdR family lipoprotein [Symbiopectobacterium]|uniref:YgdI/YgdR family lipoprotein n=1 Tax=Symbiopectobacterium purcellii TaxID=2871826 RepID=A0ABX9AJU4_9ENTR|nr:MULTISPECIES: YgdI/YgdR family lipoprotein [Symbiopectobacterium]MCW2474920.1 YgdI/YgdR family lipoprotein [Candidatus Symbiopectobacterium sp. NZEC151]MCW2487352.1 YgdI/YgdR family lipoprotein [Candidatus Symbiopectobacterium sp. NZEC127]QZN95307.1 YgdI/YgdR family lipoprotein [Symbiopectobacterium purcellii]
MKNKIAIIAIAMAALSLTACSSNYVLHTNDGRTIVAEGKPKVDEDTGMIRYIDAYGHEQQINRDNLREMVEAK